jgi:hypothetical protein
MRYIKRSGAFSFWLVVYFSAKTLTLAISSEWLVIGPSYFTCVFLVTRPFNWDLHYLDLDLGVLWWWPPLECILYKGICVSEMHLVLTFLPFEHVFLLQILNFMINYFSTYLKYFHHHPPVRIWIRTDPPHPLVCHRRRLNGAVLLMRPEKLRSSVTAGVTREISVPAQRPRVPSIGLNFEAFNWQRWCLHISEIFLSGT